MHKNWSLTLARVPVFIMAGAQMRLDLRKVGEGENAQIANSFRFNISIVVDFPIANFHTRWRSKRNKRIPPVQPN